jgi:hypothetical protein
MPTHDPTVRRRARRAGRQRGCTLDIPQEVLEQAGFDSNGAPPFYRTWASRKSRGAVYVQLYEKAS